ncbi:MAG: ROK family protein [Lysobacterales bacterium]
MNVLVIDVGGSHVKFRSTTQSEKQKIPSGPEMTPKDMVSQVKTLCADWHYNVVSIGYPGPVHSQHIVSEPHNLGTGWVGFDFQAAFNCPVRLINDAAMQALGGYRGGKMLFLGFGTGLGSAMIVESIVEPMELGHLPYKKGTYEDYVGERALDTMGMKKWRKHVLAVIDYFRNALEPDEVLLGGGNTKHLDKLPPRCRRGDNSDAFEGGFRLWKDYANNHGTPDSF